MERLTVDMRHLTTTVLLITALVLLGRTATAAPPLDRATYRTSVVTLIKNHCIKCHGPDTQESDLRLDKLTIDFTNDTAAAKWLEVMDNLNLGEMPPADETRPPTELVARVTDWIATELRHATSLAQGTGGRVLLRRLSRTEYANVVRDLLEIQFLPNEGPSDLLPPDGTLNGFDKVSRALLLDPSLMEKYFDVASVVASKAVITGPPPVPTRKNRLQYEEIRGGIEYIKHQRSTIVTDAGIISMMQVMRSDDQLRHPWNDTLIPIRGTYRMRIRVGAERQDREALYIRVTRGGDGDIYFGKVPGTLENPEVIEVVRAFDTPGQDEIGIRFENGTDFTRVNYHFSDLRKFSSEAIKAGDTRLAGRIRAQGGAQGFPGQSRPTPQTRTTDRLPRVLFDWIELEGPLYEQWPPKSTELVFFRGLDESRFDGEYAQAIFARLLPRAYRRPVTPDEVDLIAGVAMKEYRLGEPFPEAIKAGIIAMLCSPNFLLLFEPLDPTAPKPRPLNDFELAARLSIFLWSSIPDGELTSLAATGRLNNESSLRSQVKRMMADGKADAIVEGFARQWLKANEFDRFAVDQNLYRDYYATENAGLNAAINAEPIEFFRHILTNDGNAADFLDADWTMANETLARYYGLAKVEGEQFVRVPLPKESHRGGLVTMAAVHKWGSDGNRTKPVERGKYVLDVLFNDPPNPPPPNVGEVEPNVSGKNLTVRQRLDMHRTIPACASCHRTIDPYGLALENFNVVGKWRTKQDGEQGWWPKEAVIDATGKLPNGVSYANVEEYRAALRAQEGRFLRALCQKMFTYALGRIVEPADRSTIDGLVARMQSNGNTLSSLIEGIVLSREFRTK
jgi:mono/diheme cytochrome c family protein